MLAFGGRHLYGHYSVCCSSFSSEGGSYLNLNEGLQSSGQHLSKVILHLGISMFIDGIYYIHRSMCTLIHILPNAYLMKWSQKYIRIELCILQKLNKYFYLFNLPTRRLSSMPGMLNYIIPGLQRQTRLISCLATLPFHGRFGETQ